MAITRVILIVLIFLQAGYVVGNQSVVIPELSRPDILVVKHDRIYILEKTTIYIYSLDEFKLLKKFGRAGEGPREFKTNVMGAPMTLSFHRGDMVVNSLNKLSYFRPEGDFIKEVKNPLDVILSLVGDKYVGMGPAPDQDNRYLISFRLFGSDFKQEKILHRTDFNVNNPRKILLPLPCFTYNPVYNDRIYVVSSSTKFSIDVYNTDGIKEYSIRKDCEKIPISEQYQRETHEWFKHDPRFKSMYESMLKKAIHFRDYFPPIRDIQVVEDTIHVITYRRKNNLWEFILIDLKGHEKKRVFVPLDTYIPFSYYPVLYSVFRGKVYTLIEDVDNEVWKLHITPLN